MRRLNRLPLTAAIFALVLGVSGTPALPTALAKEPPKCEGLKIDPKASKEFSKVTLPEKPQCQVRVSNGYPLPDPNCTPGAVNPTLTLKVLKNPRFKTGCIRDKATSSAKKADTYYWYGVQHPKNNSGKTQTCELDHLISLELGGADTLDNIWPQCGPKGAALPARYFKEKDIVENWLAKKVRDGLIDLEAAQKGIAFNWTQYLDVAKKETGKQ